MIATAPVLEVRGLSKRFGGVRAVDGIDFRVLPGETLGIIGPNGSGKTTTFNLIGGTLRPDAGEILIEGARVTATSPDCKAELGVARTFQNGRVFGNMTVEENELVGMHARLRAARPFAALRHVPVLEWVPLLCETALALVQPSSVREEERSARVEVGQQLARFGERLLPRRDAPAYSLSYANRRRAEIARALALHPRLLMLDEPTAGMNPSETAELLEQIAELRAQGFTILLIEHKLDMIMSLSDRVIVLDEGRIIAEGTPAHVQRDPAVIEAYLGRATARSNAAAGMPEDSNAPALLELQGVDVFYGPLAALCDVSLQVRSGEIVCLLGGNASGKSTTMKTILGLLAPAKGRILLDGEDATHLSTAQRIRKELASVPEARRVFPAMSVEENLLMGALVRRDREVRADLERMYALFPKLAERRLQLAGTLSGGEQQMLAIARALMSRPRLVCMDEPTMGLAPVFVERVLETIVDINRLGASVFMVEQNANLALTIAHRGYVLQNGRIVLSGPAAGLLDNPAVQEAYLGQRAALETPPDSAGYQHTEDPSSS